MRFPTAIVVCSLVAACGEPPEPAAGPSLAESLSAPKPKPEPPIPAEFIGLDEVQPVPAVEPTADEATAIELFERLLPALEHDNYRVPRDVLVRAYMQTCSERGLGDGCVDASDEQRTDIVEELIAQVREELDGH